MEQIYGSTHWSVAWVLESMKLRRGQHWRQDKCTKSRAEEQFSSISSAMSGPGCGEQAAAVWGMRMEIVYYGLDVKWWWGMAIACLPALTSRYLVPGKFAVTKNLSNASKICRICSPSKRSACGQWNVRVLPPISHFETPSPAPALSYTWIETTKLRPRSSSYDIACKWAEKWSKQAKEASVRTANNIVRGISVDRLLNIGFNLKPLTL